VIARDDLTELARTHRMVPITRTLFADAETPVGVYRKLAAGRPGTFLLESAEPGASFSRWSFVGVNAIAALTVADGEATWTGAKPADLPTGGDPLAVLGAAWRAMKGTRLPGLPPLTGGFVGYLGYDVVRRIERLPSIAVDELGLPELTMLLATDIAAVDHHECTVVLIANALVDASMSAADLDAAYDDAVQRLDAMQAALATPAPATVATIEAAPPKDATSRTPVGQYQPSVELALEAVRAGEVFQIQVGQRFSVETNADPLDVYRVLRTLNPSPYMYLLTLESPSGEEYSIVGSSPEALVKVADGRVITHPIAGSKPRGETPEQDVDLADELLADPKEQAEHLMLVDLARNDLSKVCVAGTVEVTEFMQVERFSHIMHLVSTVEGDLRPDATSIDVFRATFPAGTLSGAPKPRALEIIDELEPAQRGVYGGVVGYFGLAGDSDLAIAIRTATIAGGMARVQAGAGLVADSDAASEHREAQNKAAAPLRAVAIANAMRHLR